MRSRSEKTQPGNPHQLAVRQHVFPKRSIERFAGQGSIDLIDIARAKRRRARADDALFCADRAWNHGAETGYMKEIEDAFQSFAEDIITTPRAVFTPAQTKAITDFFALWRARADRRHLPMQRIGHPGTRGTRVDHSQDDLELLEKHNIIGTAADGTFAVRDLMAATIYLDIDRFGEQLEGRAWGLIQALEGEFCVPDVPMGAIVPLTPRLALVIDSPSGLIDGENLAVINQTMVSQAREYYFARDLGACPGVRVGERLMR